MITNPEAKPTVQPTSSDARPHWYALLGSFAGRWMSAWPAGASLGLPQAGGGSPALSRKSESSMGASSRAGLDHAIEFNLRVYPLLDRNARMPQDSAD